MIGLDTNVIIRYLVQDHPGQAQKASRFIEKSIAAGETLWICQITLCEIFWVLERSYELSREELVSTLKMLLRTRQIRIERDDIVKLALQDYERNPKVDFPDCMIGRQNASFECVSTCTFDKNAAKQLPDRFSLLP